MVANTSSYGSVLLSLVEVMPSSLESLNIHGQKSGLNRYRIETWEIGIPLMFQTLKDRTAPAKHPRSANRGLGVHTCRLLYSGNRFLL
jgi:hypothetical protein